MRIRLGLAGIIGMLCLMVGVIAGGRASVSTPDDELAAGELVVGGAADTHDHDDGEDHAHADDHGDGHADGEDHGHADGAAHAHDPSDPGHAAGAGHAHDPSDPAHAHDPSDPGHADHAPGDPTHPHTPGDPTHPHVPGDPTHPHPPTEPQFTYTAEQLDLLARTQAWISPRFASVSAAVAAGYTSIGDASTGFEHFVNNEYLNTPTVLDPQTIESLVYRVEPGGGRTLVSGMYILPIGQTMANVPPAYQTVDTPWHVHTNLCWALNPLRVVGTTSSGQAGCPRGSVYFATPPMLHVWLENTPCGWFADLESFTGDCSLHPH